MTVEPKDMRSLLAAIRCLRDRQRASVQEAVAVLELLETILGALEPSEEPPDR